MHIYLPGVSFCSACLGQISLNIRFDQLYGNLQLGLWIQDARLSRLQFLFGEPWPVKIPLSTFPPVDFACVCFMQSRCRKPLDSFFPNLCMASSNVTEGGGRATVIPMETPVPHPLFCDCFGPHLLWFAPAPEVHEQAQGATKKTSILFFSKNTQPWTVRFRAWWLFWRPQQTKMYWTHLFKPQVLRVGCPGPKPETKVSEQVVCGGAAWCCGNDNPVRHCWF